MSKERTIVFYHLELSIYKGRKITQRVTLEEELKKVLGYINSLSKQKKKHNDSKSNRIYFLDAYIRDDMYNLRFKSAKYNHVRNVINIDTLEEKGKLKGKKDGDEEKTHLSIFTEDENNAICLFEYNYYGISLSAIEFYLNAMAGEYYSLKTEQKVYKFEFTIIPNDDFLKALGEMRTISVASFIIDKKDLNTSDFMEISQLNDIRDDVEIKVKRTRKDSIKKSTIENYFNKKSDNKRIKRILVSGTNNNGPIYLDTERMKTKCVVNVETEIDTGEVKSESIFKEFKKQLLGDGENENLS